MKNLIFLILIAIQLPYFAQSKKVPRDTSYTTYSTYNKLVGEYPSIKIVDSVLPDNVNVYRNIPYINYGKRCLELDLLNPIVDEKPKPVVVLVHGGGWKTGDKSLMFPLALTLANEGYIAITVEYRLSDEANFPAAIVDIKNSIKWLKKHANEYKLDTNRIALLGCSAGGQIASLVAYAQNEKDFEDSTFSGYSSKVSGVLNIDGLLDFLGKGSEEFDENPDPQKPRMAHRWLGASQIENPEIWKKASPIHYLNENSVPILFINSSRPRFHAGRDEAILKFEEFNIYYEVHTLENSPHSFWLFHPWYKETTNIALNFLKKIFN